MYFIYIIENLVDSKSYVGQTANPDFRWRKHRKASLDCPYLHRAIRKHGRKQFNFSIIESCGPIDQANEKEAYWIKELDTLAPNGYNLKAGGLGGGPDSPETRLRKSLSKRGEKNSFYGHKHSEETKRKISQTKTGVPIKVSSEDRERRRKFMAELRKHDIGRKFSKEHRLNIAAGQRGRTHSQEAKRKMSEARREWWAAQKQTC